MTAETWQQQQLSHADTAGDCMFGSSCARALARLIQHLAMSGCGLLTAARADTQQRHAEQSLAMCRSVRLHQRRGRSSSRGR